MENQNGFGSGENAACCLPECCSEVKEARSEFTRFKEALREFVASLERREPARECRCACC
jgi:hypothetical protein